MKLGISSEDLEDLILTGLDTMKNMNNIKGVAKEKLGVKLPYD
jgi:hypothetical protein